MERKLVPLALSRLELSNRGFVISLSIGFPVNRPFDERGPPGCAVVVVCLHAVVTGPAGINHPNGPSPETRVFIAVNVDCCRL